MIFRVLDDRFYGPISVQDETAFLDANSGGAVKFIDVSPSDLPEIPAPRPRFYCYDKDGNIVPDEERIAEEWAKQIVEMAQMTADAKTEAAKTLIAGRDVSLEQEQRYEHKYAMAQAYLANPIDDLAALFQAEAEAAGVTVEQLCQAIVQTGDAWRQAVAAYSLMIDGGRVAINKLVADGKLEAAQWLLDQLSRLGADATPQELADLVKEAQEMSGASAA